MDKAEAVALHLNRWIKSSSLLLKNCSARRFLLTLSALQLLIHLPVLNLPPMGTHTWRQVMGQATARNYFEENNSFLYPRQDVRKERDDNGVSFFEFPLIYYLIAQSYRVTGYNNINSRVTMLITAILLLVAAYRLAKAIGLSEISSRWFIFFISFSPYFFYYSVTVMPNLPALVWFTLGLSFIIPEVFNEKWGLRFWTGVALIALGTLSKASLLFFGLPVAYIFVTQYLKTENTKIILAAAGAAFFILSLNGAQYFHAKNLLEQAPPERQIYTELAPHQFPADLAALLKILKPAVTTWFFEFFVNSAAIPIFTAGVIAGFLNGVWRQWYAGFFALWTGSFLIFSLFFMAQLREHSYYQTPMLLIAAIISACGIQFLLNGRLTRWIAVLCLLVMPFSMIGRVYHRWTSYREVPAELLEQSASFERIIPLKDRVIVVGDRSPVITLYFIHRKGLVIAKDSVKKKIAELKPLGFKWIVSKGELSSFPEIEKSAKINYRIGRFNISGI